MNRAIRGCLWLAGLAVFGLAMPRAQTAASHPELGRPVIRNWTMRDYGAFPQNWVVRQDREGRMYFGNRDGVLMYDGQRWRTLAMPGVFIRGLDFDSSGRLYAGGVDELGYFDRTELGEWGPYVSLLDRVPEAHRQMGDVREVAVLADGVYFVTARKVLRFADGQFTVKEAETEWNLFGYRAGAQLLVHQMHGPLRELVNGAWVEVSAHPALLETRLAAVTRRPDGGWLLAWPDGRMGLLRGDMLEAWAEDNRDWLARERIRTIRGLPGGEVAVVTEQDGVVLFDATGTFRQRIDPSAGLYNPIVRDLMQDAEGGLWFAMNHGVAHVDALAGFTLFDSQNGLGRNTVRAVVRQGDELFAATAEGVYRLRPSRDGRMAAFAFVPGTESDVAALQSHPGGLLVGAREGLFQLVGPELRRERVADGLVSQLLARPGDADRLWLSGTDGVYPVDYDGSAWTLGPRLPAPAVEPRTLAELPDGSLWTSTPTRGLLRWTAPMAVPPPSAESLFEAAGLPTGHGWMRIVRWGDELVASSSLGLYRWDGAAGRFARLEVPGAAPDAGSRNVFGGDPDALWTFFGRSRQEAHILRLRRSGELERLPQTIVQVIGDVEVLWREGRGNEEVLWVGGSYGLARVDLKTVFEERTAFGTLISGVERAEDPVRRGGTLVWPHGRAADLRVQFAAPTYRSGRNLRFQTWLEGYEDQWGAWTEEAAREFTNLSGGNYRLRVRARDADGRVGEEAVLAFAVAPPWWQTFWAYLTYAVAGALLISAIVRWRLAAAERERVRLQLLVAERTCQLVDSQRNLVQAKEAAEAANRAKSAFLASMSHELRTPLNSVLGYAQILRRSGEVGPGAKRVIETIQRSGDHLLHLINEVLDLAKVEAGRIELHESPLPLGRFAESITDLFTVRVADRQIVFSGPDPSALKVTVRADEARLRQVLLNLLGNAFKFTERGEIRWSIEPIARHGWRFEVRDTGVGIAPREQQRIFEPFYQSAAQPALARQGTGLGLSISAHLVQLMGGRLRVESAPGQGSRFWFELALPKVEVAPVAGPAAWWDSSAIVGYRGRRRRLLVVDDERTNRAILEEMLTPLGFVIEEASCADEARGAIARQLPDAVLLDLRMPGDDGFALAREWRQNGVAGRAKILALSASVLPEQQSEAIAAGCDAFLGKPFREEQLLRVLGSLLELDWLESGTMETADVVEPSASGGVRWEPDVLRRLLQLAERGDALRVGQELAVLARQGAAWAAAVAPWQKLTVGYQMEALSRALSEALNRMPSVET